MKNFLLAVIVLSSVLPLVAESNRRAARKAVALNPEKPSSERTEKTAPAVPKEKSKAPKGTATSTAKASAKKTKRASMTPEEAIVQKKNDVKAKKASETQRRIENVESELEHYFDEKHELTTARAEAKDPVVHTRVTERALNRVEEKIQKANDELTRLSNKIAKETEPVVLARLKKEAKEERAKIAQLKAQLKALTDARATTLKVIKTTNQDHARAIRKMPKEDEIALLKALRKAYYNHDNAQVDALEEAAGLKSPNIKDLTDDLAGQSKDRAQVKADLAGAKNKYKQVANGLNEPTLREIRRDELVAELSSKEESGLRPGHYTNLAKEVEDAKV